MSTSAKVWWLSALLTGGLASAPEALLDTPRAGYLRTPDDAAYSLQLATEVADEEGGPRKGDPVSGIRSSDH